MIFANSRHIKHIYDFYDFLLSHTHGLSCSAAEVFGIPVADAVIRCKLHKAGVSCFHTVVIIAIRDLFHAVSKTEDMLIFRFLCFIPLRRLFLKWARQYKVQFDLWIALSQFQNGKSSESVPPNSSACVKVRDLLLCHEAFKQSVEPS